MLEIGVFTDKGKSREINEDKFYVSDFDKNIQMGYCIIADGMGGHNSGEVASQMAISEINSYIKQRLNVNMSYDEIVEMIRTSLKRANTVIYNKSFDDEKFEGMGTTTIVCFIYTGQLFIAHVGDSRAYLIKDNSIHQLTTDHSMVEELINSGTITREEAANHPKKNVITRAIGAEKDILIDIYVVKYFKDDILLICTDGLTNVLTNDEIFWETIKKDDMQTIVNRLANIAKNKGGTDDITVVGVRL